MPFGNTFAAADVLFAAVVPPIEARANRPGHYKILDIPPRVFGGLAVSHAPFMMCSSLVHGNRRG